MAEAFAEPSVRSDVYTAVELYFETHGSVRPWTVIDDVSSDMCVEQQEVRRVLRRLKMDEGRLVPAEPFVGAVRLVAEDD